MSTAPFWSPMTSIVEVGGEYFTALSSNCRAPDPASSRSASTVQAVGNALDDRVPVQSLLELLQRRADHVVDRDAIATDDEIAGVDAQHVHGVGDERLQPVQVLVDDRDQFPIAASPTDSTRRSRSVAAFIEVSGVLNS